MIISTKNTYIHYVSQCYEGKSHDYSMLKAEFDPAKKWFKKFIVRVDLAYLGFDKCYDCKQVIMPDKKPRKGELTPNQKRNNKKKSSKRIKVEHSIGGMKRYRILADRLRIHDISLYNSCLEICAGLWNFNLSY